MNDNKDQEKIVRFKKKTITNDESKDAIASVFIRKGLVGLEVKDGLIFLNQNTLIQLVLVLLSAFKIRNDFTLPQE